MEKNAIISVCMAINAYKRLVIGRKVAEIYENFGQFWRELTSETQLRWVLNTTIRSI